MEPSQIFVGCSKAPDDRDSIAEFLKGKGVPVTIIGFDEGVEEDPEGQQFFADLCGEKGGMMVDTSGRDLDLVDKMLKSVG